MTEVNNALDHEWWSLQWFTPSILNNFTWEFSWVLFLILLIPLLFILKWLLNIKLKQRLPIALTKRELQWSAITLLRFIPPLFFALAMALLLIALARPQKTNERVEQWTEGIDITMVVDISGSMQIEDFKPNRLVAAKKVCSDFVKGRFQDRIGLVIFSGEAYSLAPLTTDYKLLEEYIEEIDFKMIANDGTAIGSALAVATNRMRDGDAKSKVIILLSDGENTAGNIDPITAAKLAAAYGIKIYTIAIGKEGRVPWGKDFFGRPRMVENTLDETTLREIADIGAGQFYRVSNNKALENVFDEIDQFEKAKIMETRFKDTQDFYDVYLKWGIIFLLCFIGLKSSFMNNVLED
ncbi:VWA domain-containing protein [Persicobacter sp. CCB-QB2]|uniref:vWA domain-containing protein n=1 Tax=Persicobacter sp. CCB-QB2 TaxID=1561025 RepID=UPI0006A9C559|nr:VWA domain-containing protein [Persicobacter sp. CCB-QB2]